MPFVYDPFMLLNVDFSHELDMETLEKKYIDAQKKIHPDQLNGLLSESAMPLSALVNQAYADLKDPVIRARRMLERSGINIETENNFRHVALEVMEWIENPATDWIKIDQLMEESFRKKWQSENFYEATEAYFKWCYVRRQLESQEVKNAHSN